MVKYKEELESLPHYYRSKFSIDCSRRETEDEKSTEMLEASQVEEVIKNLLLRQIDEDNKRFLGMIESKMSNQKIDEGHDCYDQFCKYCENNIRDSVLFELRDKVNKK